MKGKNSSVISVVIIDDEQEGRDVVAHLLKRFQEIRLVEICDDPDRGIAAVVRLNPDIVFLDIRMPRKSGLEVARELAGLRVKSTIVFITAYDRFAIQAIKLAAFDYLLKPVDPDDLRRVIDKFKKIGSK